MSRDIELVLTALGPRLGRGIFDRGGAAELVESSGECVEVVIEQVPVRAFADASSGRSRVTRGGPSSCVRQHSRKPVRMSEMRKVAASRPHDDLDLG